MGVWKYKAIEQSCNNKEMILYFSLVNFIPPSYVNFFVKCDNCFFNNGF